MINKNIGGIERSHIIKFLFRVLATQHYNLIINALNDEDIIIACLRIAWNDAFRHVSKNQPNAKKKQDFKAMHNKDVNEYIVNCILRNEIVLNSFLNYCRANTPAEKVLSLENDINNGLLRCFEDVKVIDKKEDNHLCFGHFQKLYNMAIKYYLCVYFCSDDLGIKHLMLQKIDLNWLECADCPIDSIICGLLDSKLVWSKIESAQCISEYLNLQNRIKSEVTHKSNLWYDFENWR